MVSITQRCLLGFVALVVLGQFHGISSAPGRSIYSVARAADGEPARENAVTLLGAIERPGMYEIPGGQPLTTVAAIDMAGGVKGGVDAKIQVVRHVGKTLEVTITFSSLAALRNNRHADFALQPKDVVVVNSTNP